MSSDSSTADQSSASMLHGHAAYVAAAAKETIGSFTSTPMQEAGAADKQAAIDEMRAAKENADASGTGSGLGTQNPTLGKIEKSVGSAVGCEGMVEEGTGAARSANDVTG
ncbi:MAG: hypothetical protein MMC33_005277 [Icmadophila ericetorum]|nr:hypothetical protein [Icmadophila ericetorum]